MPYKKSDVKLEFSMDPIIHNLILRLPIMENFYAPSASVRGLKQFDNAWTWQTLITVKVLSVGIYSIYIRCAWLIRIEEVLMQNVSCCHI